MRRSSRTIGVVLILFVSGCSSGQEREVRYENTVNFAAVYRNQNVTLAGKVVRGNPVKGAGTVYVLQDDTGRPCEVRARSSFPEIGSRVKVEGYATSERAYSGNMTVFRAERLVAASYPNLLAMLGWTCLVAAVLATAMVGLLVGVRRTSHTRSFQARGERGTIVYGPQNPVVIEPGATLQVLQGLPGISSIPLPRIERIVFGRNPSHASVPLRIDNEYVSENHGEFFYDSDTQKWTIQAGAATNVTRLNGRPLHPGECAPLVEKDRIQIGNLIVIFHLIDAVQDPSDTSGGL